MKTLILLLLPFFSLAQTGVIYKSSLSKDYTVKGQLDSLAGIVNTSVNSLSSTVAGKADVSLVNTKTSFSQVSDSVYSKAERTAILSDLRNVPVMQNKIVMLIGRNNVGDNLGGFYRWDADSSGTDEMTYLNKISSNLTTQGRWNRVFVRARSTAGGIMVNNGGVKTFYVSGTTNSSGKVVLNLTTDGTSTGTPLFTEIWSIVTTPVSDASGPATAVQSYRESLPSDLKVLTYGFYKANAFTVVLAALVTPVASVGAGTVVQFSISGI